MPLRVKTRMCFLQWGVLVRSKQWKACVWRMIAMHDGIARQDADVLLAVGRPCAQHVCARHSAVLLSSCRSAASSCSGTWRMAVARRDGACKLSTQLRVLSLRAREIGRAHV